MTTHTPATYEGAISLDVLQISTDVVDTSGVVEQLAEWDSADRAGRGLGGRPAHVPVRAELILFILPALLGKHMYVRESFEILRYRLGGKAWKALNIDLRKWDSHTATTWYDRLWRTLRYRVRDVIDPFPETPHWRRLSKEEYAELEASRDPEFGRRATLVPRFSCPCWRWRARRYSTRTCLMVGTATLPLTARPLRSLVMDEPKNHAAYCPRRKPGGTCGPATTKAMG